MSAIQITAGAGDGCLAMRKFVPAEPIHAATAMDSFYQGLQPDIYGPGRNRAYAKLDWRPSDGSWEMAQDQRYFQTKYANETDGGKVRIFQGIAETELRPYGVLHEMLNEGLRFIDQHFAFTIDTVTVGVHAVQYIATRETPSTSSPPWLHRDDEPAVVLTVLGESQGLLGGDTILADMKGEDKPNRITRVIHLDTYDACLLDRSGFHAVTPMGVAPGYEVAWRRILLITTEVKHEFVMVRP